MRNEKFTDWPENAFVSKMANLLKSEEIFKLSSMLPYEEIESIEQVVCSNFKHVLGSNGNG